MPETFGRVRITKRNYSPNCRRVKSGEIPKTITKKPKTMNAYVDIEQLNETIFELFKETLENYGDKENACDAEIVDFFLGSDCDYLKEYVEEYVQRLNCDMGKYLHFEDTSIDFNLNSIRDNYAHGGWGIEKCALSCRMAMDEIVRTLDEGITSDDTRSFIGWVTEWFWATFGTYNMRYNFIEEINSMVESLERDAAGF